MSILIKGMEMPKEGNYSARLNVNRDGTALLFLYGECGGHPAKEIPPHGRLIDADALLDELQKLFDKRENEARFTGNRGIYIGWNDAIFKIKTAPTVIEAEVKE